MATDATGLELITIPKMDAAGLSALLGQVIATSAAEKKVPSTLKKRVELMDEAKTKLTAALAARTGKVESDDPRAVEADSDEDQAVGALVKFLEAYAKLKTDQGKAARRVLGAVFGGGTGFLVFEHPKEWAEVEARLVKIDTEGYAETIVELGGKGFLDHLRAVHQVYGEVLGITAAKGSKEAAPDIRGAQNEAANQLRRYVAAVIGHGAQSDIDPTAGELAAALLAPIHEARAKASTRKGGSDGSQDESDGTDGEGGTEGDATK